MHEQYKQPQHNVEQTFEQTTEQAPKRLAAYPVSRREVPDWRRLEVAANRYSEAMSDGTEKAMKAQSDIDDTTARCIAHVFSRSLNEPMALTEYATTGIGNYERLRDEYLVLYKDPDVTEQTLQLLNWFGSYVIHQHYPDAQVITTEELHPPKLHNILVPTQVSIRGMVTTVHVPGP